LGVIEPHDALDIFGRAAAGLAALHVNDGAERALIGTAAAGVEAGGAGDGALRPIDPQQRNRRALDPRQVVHVIIERLERAGVGIAQHQLEPAFRLACDQRQAYRPGAVEIGVDAAEHRQHAGDVEAADADLDAALAQRPRQIERARELVRLHAGEHHHAGAGFLDHRRQAFGADAGVDFVEGVDVDVIAEHAAIGAILGEAVQRGQRIRRDRRAQPLET
jgi:hypothetical protein